MLLLDDVRMAFGDRVVLDGASLTLAAGERAGLVGPNGTGKTTLLRIAAGLATPDHGSVVVSGAVGYLPQAHERAPYATIREVVRAARVGLEAATEAVHRAEAALARDGSPAALREYADAVARFEAIGGWDLDHAIRDVLGGLGLAGLPQDRDVETLSGGERARVALAGLLLATPALLLLDEPTNHLDDDALAWLERYLAAFQGALLVVSHDRVFLDATVNAILELDEHEHRLARYGGTYADYREARDAERRRYEEQFAREQAEQRRLERSLHDEVRRIGHNRPARDNDKNIVAKGKANVEKTVGRRSAATTDRLERLRTERLRRPPARLRVEPRFSRAVSQARVSITASDLVRRFDRRTVLDGISLDIGAETRLIVTGPNGSGKSTLMRLLARIDEPDEGAVRWRADARIAYLGQEPVAPTAPTLREAFLDGLPGESALLERALLGYGLFHPEHLRKPTHGLSVGELRKLELARLIARAPDVLLLDEPTNHLALDIVEELEAAILAYRGGLVIATHDRRLRSLWDGDELRLSTS